MTPTPDQPAVWRRIEDGAPKDGTRVFLLSRGDTEPVIGSWCVAADPYKFEGWSTGWETVGGYDAGYAYIGTPDYWLPLDALPPPPGEGDGGRGAVAGGGDE